MEKRNIVVIVEVLIIGILIAGYSAFFLLSNSEGPGNTALTEQMTEGPSESRVESYRERIGRLSKDQGPGNSPGSLGRLFYRPFREQQAAPVEVREEAPPPPPRLPNIKYAGKIETEENGLSYLFSVNNSITRFQVNEKKGDLLLREVKRYSYYEEFVFLYQDSEIILSSIQ